MVGVSKTLQRRRAHAQRVLNNGKLVTRKRRAVEGCIHALEDYEVTGPRVRRGVRRFSDEFALASIPPVSPMRVHRRASRPTVAVRVDSPATVRRSFASLSVSAQRQRVEECVSLIEGVLPETCVVVSLMEDDCVREAFVDDQGFHFMNKSAVSETPEKKALRLVLLADAKLYSMRQMQDIVKAFNENDLRPYHLTLARARLDEICSETFSLQQPVPGVQLFFLLPSEVIRCMLSLMHDEIECITVVHSGDGFRTGNSSAVQFCIRCEEFTSYVVHELKMTALDAVVTVAVLKGSECRENVSIVYKAIAEDLTRLERDGLKMPNGRTVKIRMTMCADAKFMSFAMGIKSPSAQYGCPFCTAPVYSRSGSTSPNRDIVRASIRTSSSMACHSACHAGCTGMFACKRMCPAECDGNHGLLEVTPMQEVVGFKNLVVDILHMKLRLADKLASLFRAGVIANVHRVRGVTHERLKSLLTEWGRRMHFHENFGTTLEVRMRGKEADSFLASRHHFSELSQLLDLGARIPSSIREFFDLIKRSMDDLSSIIAHSHSGTMDNLSLDCLCKRFAKRLIQNFGSRCRPLYLHIVEHHLASMVCEHDGLGQFCCEIVERKNYCLREAMTRVSSGQTPVFDVMKWSMRRLLALQHQDLYLRPRPYDASKRRASAEIDDRDSAAERRRRGTRSAFRSSL